MGVPVDKLRALPYIRRMDFKSMVLDLKELGMSQTEIGAAVGAKQATVSDWLTGRTKGKRISYQTAEALKKFHAQKMKESRRAA